MTVKRTEQKAFILFHPWTRPAGPVEGIPRPTRSLVRGIFTNISQLKKLARCRRCSQHSLECCQLTDDFPAFLFSLRGAPRHSPDSRVTEDASLRKFARESSLSGDPASISPLSLGSRENSASHTRARAESALRGLNHRRNLGVTPSVAKYRG